MACEREEVEGKESKRESYRTRRREKERSNLAVGKEEKSDKNWKERQRCTEKTGEAIVERRIILRAL